MVAGALPNHHILAFSTTVAVCFHNLPNDFIYFIFVL